MQKVYILEWFTGQHNSAVFTTPDKARDAFATLADRMGAKQPRWAVIGNRTQNAMLSQPVRYMEGGVWCDAATLVEVELDAAL